MAVGAQDYIDKLIVKKYAKAKVDNHDVVSSMVSPEKMMSAMNDYSTVSRNMFLLQQKLKQACSSVNNAGAVYKRRALT